MKRKICILCFYLILVLNMQGNSLDDLATAFKNIDSVFIELNLHKINFNNFDSKFQNGSEDIYTFRSGGPKGVAVHVIIGDVLQQGAQVIVNAANVGLVGGSGMDTVIEKAAKKHFGSNVDVVSLYWASGKPNDWGEGKAFFNTKLLLPGNVHVVQAVTPHCSVDKNGKSALTPEQKKKLRDVYYNSLDAAETNNKTSIAFPLLGAGVFKCDSKEAAFAAAEGIFEYFLDHPHTILKDVYIVIYHTFVGGDLNDPDARFKFWIGDIYAGKGSVVDDWAKAVGGESTRIMSKALANHIV